MLSSSQLTSEAVDMDELRARLREMSDADLTAFGKAARLENKVELTKGGASGKRSGR